jgi:hypothetical protein
VVSVSGAFSNGAGGTVTTDIGGTSTTQFGRVTVTGAATLDGTLSLNVVNGFSPVAGNTFPIMTYASRSGQFATINGLTIGNGNQFNPTYNATNLTLGVVAAAGPTVVPADGDPAGSGAPGMPGIAGVQVADSDIHMHFTTAAGTIYRVEYCNDLAEGQWHVLIENVSGADCIMTLIDPDAANLRQRFYRVVVVNQGRARGARPAPPR